MNASEKTDYESEKLTIDCPNIVLEPISGENLKRLNGPGLIIQKVGGGFLLKVFITERTDLRDIIERMKRLKSGKLLDSSEYYRMSAADLNGVVWACDSLYPVFSPNGSVLTADLHQITEETHFPVKILTSSLTMKFSGSFKIPANTGSQMEKQIAGMTREVEAKANVCRFSSCNMDVEIIQEDKWMIVSVTSTNREIDELIACRINEALQFCMGRQLKWSTMTLLKIGKEQTYHRGIIRNENKGRSYPPVAYHEHYNVVYAIRLMDLYLAKTINHKDKAIHPLFHPLYAVTLASESTVETEALTLSTSIESLLDIAISVKQDKAILDGLNLLSKHINSRQYTAIFKQRLNGLLGMMKTPSATQKLNQLAKDGITTKELVRVWKALRPKLAHGNYAISDFQGFLDKVHAVHVLLHHLLFHSIGYHGGYTDYSKEGWPVLKYPDAQKTD